MSERDDPDDGPVDETDARAQEVRRLLGELGSQGAQPPGPVPADVAARLEETLAGLVVEEQAARISEERPATTNVVPLRPRWMPRLAAGAAAVIVLGLGGVAVSQLGSGQDGAVTADSAGSSAESGAGSDAGGGVAEPVPSEASGDGKVQGLVRAPEVSSARFDQDVAALLAADPPLRRSARAQEQQDLGSRPSSGASPNAGADDAAMCPGPALTDGSRTTLISLDGTMAVLVLRPFGRGAQPVEAWSCDGTTRLAQGSVDPRN